MEVDLARVSFVPVIKVGGSPPLDGDDSGAVDGWGLMTDLGGWKTHTHVCIGGPAQHPVHKCAVPGVMVNLEASRLQFT